MQMLGFIALFAAGVAVVVGLSAAIYVYLPKAVLAHAERHGRFQGLRGKEKLVNGTRVEEPSITGPMALAE